MRTAISIIALLLLISAHTTMGQEADLLDLGFEQTENYQAEFQPHQKSEHLHRLSQRHLSDIPSSINWVDLGYVSPVQDEGPCTAGWAFAATAAVESLQIMAGNIETLRLSEQQIIDCVGEEDGCSPHWVPTEAFIYILNDHKLFLNSDYPYTGIEYSYCEEDYISATALFGIEGYVSVQANNHTALEESVAISPTTVTIKQGGFFPNYNGGVLADCGYGENNYYTQSALVVGYGTTPGGTPYWLLKNSWGTSWGDNGYFKLFRGEFNSCGILDEPVRPTTYWTREQEEEEEEG